MLNAQSHPAALEASGRGISGAFQLLNVSLSPTPMAELHTNLSPMIVVLKAQI